ncbi:sel1 repeat family protein [Legionella sp. PATHC035]|uniref:sel1 repeat family protein n=1 Tax=Legionella sp. PATHC035 TaxID=2992040 RepID=UPI0022438C12|nr:sel1 repeat family protein [Legionella sp. PATHC035]MCW8410018.1 sel1 repeat family protein [Legionella sp. PATHC035]
MRRLLHLLIVVIFISNLVACATTNAINLREGIDSFRVENYRKAFIRLKPIAERGQPDAQYAVGYMYYYGKGVVEDRKKAWFWINAAANLGQPDAKEAVRILASGGSLS